MLTHDEFVGYLKGNVVKYLWRARLKGAPAQDLQKARWYLERLNKCLDNKNCLIVAERLKQLQELCELVEANRQEAADTKPEQRERKRKDQKEAQTILSKRRLAAWFPFWKSV